ncbi:MULTISPECIES: hypothetical protein [Melioribacter]|nr:hypothetical protein [Melioribacter roseus]
MPIYGWLRITPWEFASSFAYQLIPRKDIDLLPIARLARRSYYFSHCLGY